MRFNVWMKKTYLNDNSFKGKLARDIKADKHFPSHRRGKTLRRYLINEGASQNIVEAFDECWEEFREYERKGHRTGTA